MKNKKEEVPVIPSGDVVTGNANAPVQLVMFGDYESEACVRANETVKNLLQEYEGSLSFVYRHFPLTRVHQRAHKAAEAAIGAAQEGKFWEMHQILFQNPRNLGLTTLKSYAREAGVTDKKFLDHLINSDWGWFVQDDLREGLKLGVKDVPAFFLNGQRLEKEGTYRNLKAALEEALKQAKVLPIKQKKRA